MLSNEKWTQELDVLCQLLESTDLQSSIKWGTPVFSYKGKNLVNVGGFKNYFALVFFNGVLLKDTQQKLINAQENKTNSMRQWRFKSHEEIDSEVIIAYIQEAKELEDLGVRPEKKTAEKPEIPELLSKTLQEDQQLAKAFFSFSPFKQKEFIEYLNSAKREETKLSRLDKITDMILLGVGLNDKYR